MRRDPSLTSQCHSHPPTQGSITKIESLMKVYGAPVVTKVSEKYPGYMTTVDSKVRTHTARQRNARDAASGLGTLNLLYAPKLSFQGI